MTPIKDPPPHGWDEALNMGIPEVDRQHKALYSQVASLCDRTQQDRVGDTLLFLQNYVVEHFGTEEKLHEETGYPHADAHLKVHAEFIQTFLKMKQEYESDTEQNGLLILMKLTKALMDWLYQHVMGMDREFAGYWHARAQNPPYADPETDD